MLQDGRKPSCVECRRCSITNECCYENGGDTCELGYR